MLLFGIMPADDHQTIGESFSDVSHVPKSSCALLSPQALRGTPVAPPVTWQAEVAASQRHPPETARRPRRTV
jgi:hypothetical protein